MKLLLAAVAAVAVLAGTAFAFAPRSEVVTEIEIDAVPDRVWAVLADNQAYGEWNPFIRSMKGEVAQGAVLENTMEPSPGEQITFRPTVLAVEPAKELRWLGRLLMPRIFDGEHYFLLEPTEAGTRLVHGEKFRGIALWFMDTAQFAKNFEAMNVALKARVEAE